MEKEQRRSFQAVMLELKQKAADRARDISETVKAIEGS
jgi:hypothetical protein